MKPNTLERVMGRLVPNENGCLIWPGARHGNGYGMVKWHGHDVSVHRLLWELLKAPLPSGILLHHVCTNKLCCNVDHLRPMTKKEHSACHPEGPDRGRRSPKRTEKCRNGHPKTPENTYVCGNLRLCRECRRIKNRRYTAEGRWKKGGAYYYSP